MSSMKNVHSNTKRNILRPHLSFFFIVISDVEVTQLVHVAVLVGRDDAQPVANVVLLQVLLGQVLHVALGHGDFRRHGDLGLVSSHGHGFAERARLTADLDAFRQKRRERTNLHNLVFNLCVVNNESSNDERSVSVSGAYDVATGAIRDAAFSHPNHTLGFFARLRTGLAQSMTKVETFFWEAATWRKTQHNTSVSHSFARRTRRSARDALQRLASIIVNHRSRRHRRGRRSTHRRARPRVARATATHNAASCIVPLGAMMRDVF